MVEASGTAGRGEEAMLGNSGGSGASAGISFAEMERRRVERPTMAEGWSGKWERDFS